MHQKDKLTGQELGIDAVAQEAMDQAWRNYRHGLPPASDTERDLYRDWAHLEGDVREEMAEFETAERRKELDTDWEVDQELAELADLYDSQPHNEDLILAAMLNDAEAAVVIGQIISAEMLTDSEYQTLFAQLAQTPGWPREPISDATINYLSQLESAPGQAIDIACDVLANHLRWQLTDRENQHLLGCTTPPQVDRQLEIPQPSSALRL